MIQFLETIPGYLYFISGAVFGAIVGVIVVALLTASKENEGLIYYRDLAEKYLRQINYGKGVKT